MTSDIRILTILGARPQFIKAGAVSRAFKSEGGITEQIFHSGQHYDFNMSDIFFEQMNIPKPNFTCNLEGRTHAKMTAEIMVKIEDILLSEAFDAVMVYGDTNTTLAGSLVSSKLHIPLIHVESGLRSFNRKMPEEVNRVLTDHVSDLLFTPTAESVKNLKSEGISRGVYLVGDVMYDATLFYKDSMVCPQSLKADVGFALATIHRQENTDTPQKLRDIIEALQEIAFSTHVVLPIHPRTRKVLQQLNIDTSGLELIDPVGYFEMLYLLDHCSAVLTDSGGLQKESYFFKKPCIILREETEWVELVNNNVGFLAGSNKTKILESYQDLDKAMNFPTGLYGNGDASNKIAKTIKSSFRN